MDREPGSWRHRLDVVARAVLVKDIAKRLPRIDAAWDIGEAQIELGEHKAWFGLVVDDRQTLGYIAVDDYAEGDHAGAAALPLQPDLLVEESMPVIELLRLFRFNPFFFAIRGNSVVSAVSWLDVDCPLGRVALMALVMEFEYALNELLVPDSAAALSCISASRLAKARELLKLKTERSKAAHSVSGASLVSCMTLADKCTAARKLVGPQARSTWAGPITFRKALQLIERVRNSTAHGNSLMEVVTTPAQLALFVDVVDYATRWIQDRATAAEPLVGFQPAGDG